MAISLERARDIVRDSALVTGDSTFTDSRVDRAIHAALGRALHVTRADTTVTNFSLS